MLFLLQFLLIAMINVVKTSGRGANSVLAPYYSSNNRLVLDTYIVRLSQNHTLAKHFAYCGVNLSNANQGFEEIAAIHSYRAQLDKFTVNRLVRTDPGVEYVEHDHYIQGPTLRRNAVYDNPDSSASSQHKRWSERWIRRPFWQLQMITAGSKRRIGTGIVNPVRILQNAGRGVNAYVVDTGVKITHKAFQGRASNFRNQTRTPYCEGGSFDMGDSSNNSHGTAVASLLGGAPGGFSISYANIINVKAFCEGEEASTWMIAKAIADITDEHRAFVRNRPAWFKGSIINLSFATDYSPTTARAMEDASRAGIVLVAAAGNSDPPEAPSLAVRNFPCNLPCTICVTSCDRAYQHSSWADYGSAVDIIAPGQQVHLAHASSDVLGFSASGTSLATPIVGSVLANFIAYEQLMTDSMRVRQRLFDNALSNVIEGLPESRLPELTTPNLLVNIPTNRDHPHGPPYVGAPD